MSGVKAPFKSWTLGGVSCAETTINGTVARVFLKRFNFDEYFANKKNTFKESNKRANTLTRRKRKTVKESIRKRAVKKTKQVQRVTQRSGRKLKQSEKVHKFIESNLNGRLKGNNETSNLNISSKRIRKPNIRFTDFILSSDSNHSSLLEEMEESVESKSSITLSEDPLAISNSDDVVYSFLPELDTTPVPSDDLDQSNVSDIKNETSNSDAKEVKETSESNVTEEETLLQADSKIESPSVRASVNNFRRYRKRGRPRLHNLGNRNIPLKKAKPVNISKDTSNSLAEDLEAEDDSSEKQTRYFLFNSVPSQNSTKSKIGNIDFNKLVRSLKLVKLPAPNWKIRIVVSRQQSINEVTFTNKEEHERCVKFTRQYSGYVITFGKSTVKLLGAPVKISSHSDITILLDIIQNISLNDPILEYDT